MGGYNHFFLHDLHGENLAVINKVHFTPREIDVISCLINLRSTSKISSLLSISSSTVLTHINNIKLKIGCNSRECIIDFMEQSSGFPLIKKHYGHVVIYAGFERILKTIKKEHSKQSKQTTRTQTSLILFGEKHIYKDLLLQHLTSQLKQAGVNIEIELTSKNLGKKIEKTQPFILILEPGDEERIPKEFCDFEVMDISGHQNYYIIVFDILEKLVACISFQKQFKNFIELYKAMNSDDLKRSNIYKNERNIIKDNQPNKKKIKILNNSLNNEKVYRHFIIILCILHCIYLFISFKETHKTQEIQKKQKYQKYQNCEDFHYVFQPSKILDCLESTDKEIGKTPKPKEVLEQRLKIHKIHPIDNPMVVAEILVYLGAIHKDLGEFKKAKRLVDQALTIYAEHLPKDHVKIAWTLAHLGNILRLMGNHMDAKAALERSLIIYEKHFPAEHMEVIWLKECLKATSQELGEHRGAELIRKGQRFERSKNEEKKTTDAPAKK